MKITFGDYAVPDSGTVVVGIYDDGSFSAAAMALDEQAKGALKKIADRQKFTGKAATVLRLLHPAGLPHEEIILLGLGKEADLDALACQKAGGVLASTLLSGKAENVVVVLDPPGKGAVSSAGDRVAEIAYGAKLRSYRFDRYKSQKNGKDGKNGEEEEACRQPVLKSLKFSMKEAAKARKAYQALEKVADGVAIARDLVTEPANVLYPESYAKRVEELKDLGLEVEVLDRKALEKQGFEGIISVGKGSERDPCLVVMQYNGLGEAKDSKTKGKGKGSSKAKDDGAPIAFIGKGITFDTGGISLKPPAGMGDMKWDMGGSAAVVGIMAALAGRQAKVNAVGVIALAENMPSGKAMRPGDVIGSLSGQTIEVLNTDAEGRLVLADALWYAEDRFKPKAMIDLATLTGAILVALGHEFAGLFTDNDDLAAKLEAAAKASGEPVWRMPMTETFNKAIDSDIADMKNIGGGRHGGSSTAAHFLRRFVRDVPWAHLDIAGMAWSSKDAPTVPKGGTGYGVRLLDQLVRLSYEK